MSYALVMRAAVVLSVALCLGLLLAPGAFWALFGIDGGAPGDFAFRRSGALFFMLALVLWSLRDLADAAARRRVAWAMALGMAAIATLGLWELTRGAVGPGLLVPVATEIAFAGAFAWVASRERAA